jgi:diaminopimelate decarboxylase
MTDSHFHYRNGVLHAENVALPHIAHKLGTPTFVYSRAALRDAWRNYQQAISGHDALVCYGMKANSNLAVINEFKELGAGFDIVSGGELARVLAVGADPSKVVFSGVGKQAWEMRAALDAGVKCFNVESAAELERLAEQARLAGRRAPVSLRVNPDVDALTHPYISTGLKENKFGIPIDQALSVYTRAQQLGSLDIVGIDCHIGSQITRADPYIDALDKLLALVRQLGEHGIALKHLDLGGGLGIRYKDETPLLPATLVPRVFARINECGLGHLELVLEPGRSLVGNAGILLTQVQYLKHNEGKNFAVVDAAMNDLIRPTLYDAWHDVLPVVPPASQDGQGEARHYDIVGPICESGDWLARERGLALEQGDLLAILSAGAYGFAMASQYNTRARAAEVMVDGDTCHVVRPRETIESLFAGETTLPKA